MTSRKAELPRVFSTEGRKAHEDEISPGCTFAGLVHGEKQDLGLYFMIPGAQTNVFSLEDRDDGTAKEYYGPCDEFYFVLVGELTMYWGSDSEKVQAGQSEGLHLKAGDMGYWSRGWKYSVKNTGSVPATFVWGLTLPPEGTRRREYTWEGPPGGGTRRSGE
jgi:mannose-6-phosphate isomerase-like protein (cupin superfamily)